MLYGKRQSLISPLQSNEFYMYFSNPEMKAMTNHFIQYLQGNADGCYAVGGPKGSGKSTWVEFVINRVQNRSKITPITVNMGNHSGSFIATLTNAMYHSDFRENIDKNSNDVLDNLYNFCFSKMNITTRVGEKGTETGESLNQTRSSLKLLLVAKLFGLEGRGGKEVAVTQQEKEALSIEDSRQVEYNRSFDDEYLLLQFQHLIKYLSQQNHNLVFVLDELDKKDESFIISLFDQYKELLIGSRVKFVMIIGQSTFSKLFGPEKDCLDGYDQYFVDSYYIGLLDWESFILFTSRKLGMTKIEDIKLHYFRTLGLYRTTIIPHKYPEIILESDHSLHIADWIIKIFMDYRIKRIPKIVLDVMKIKIKKWIEHLSIVEKLTSEQTEEFLSRNVPKEYLVYLNQFFVCLKENTNSNKRIITYGYDLVNITDSKLYFFFNHNLIQEHAVKQDVWKVSKYHYLWKNYSNGLLAKEMSDIVELSYREHPRLGENKIVNLINSSRSNLISVLTFSKYGGYCGEIGCAYSCVAVIDEEIGQVAYIVDNFSHSYESTIYWKKVQQELNALKIEPIHLTIENTPLKNSLHIIFKELYNKMQ
ncbi:P-loop NTPase fold protein [Brevibacillus sp. BC25]|uniref:P-loop NTPase fold protein n=1 Tax=Brevibacillus sp. BC25 TaxID=1144308 RepID=UPI000271473A|nr:P-loop NTPase fold protein [Brevibacillus sp. BC25]EJL27030.1 hypothetical protein PMI05_02897 [Brevibacillus sp. BC25]